MPTIEIYPETPRPPWMKKGAICKCLGEGNTQLRVVTIGKNAAFLETLEKLSHGWESFRKLQPYESQND